MKFIRHLNKNSLLVLVASSIIVIAPLGACGGGGGDKKETTSAVDPTAPAMPTAPTAPTDGTSPAFDLNGFVECGNQGATLDLKKRTHVALGLDDEALGIKSGNSNLVYLFNQIGKVKLEDYVFGSWGVDWTLNKGYCKEVTANNNDAAVFSAALFKIKAHLDGSAVMTAAELQEQNDRITQTTYTVAENKTNITRAFDVIKAYEVKEKGPFFINAKTKGSFPNHSSKPDGFEIDRAVLAIQQSIFDFVYTPAGLATYRDTLVGKKFNSSDWFPGRVKAPAAAGVVYTIKINANMAEDAGKQTAFSQGIARRPTGYYLAAGDIAKVTVPTSLVNVGFVIRVGASVHNKSGKLLRLPTRTAAVFTLTCPTWQRVAQALISKSKMRCQRPCFQALR
jgi:hypothetical protein